jgi:hypothetical protein
MDSQPMKPRLFIGSSSEALTTLGLVAGELADVANCRAWPGIFEQNKSGLASLLKEARVCDFGILIATQDDLRESRGTTQLTPRDNVIFEFGLFLGAVSPNRVFLLAETGTALPSDLNGINVSFYTLELGKHNSLPAVCKQISQLIKKMSSQSELGFLPSTALAVGYYHNFVRPLCKYLHQDGRVYLQNQSQPIHVRSFKLNVLLPADLSSNGVNDFVARYNRHHNLQAAATEMANSQKRGYPFHFRIDPPEQDLSAKVEVQLFDVPTTLTTIVKSIDLCLDSSFIGKDDNKQYLKSRELANFANVLQTLVDDDDNAKSCVEIALNIKL